VKQVRSWWTAVRPRQNARTIAALVVSAAMVGASIAVAAHLSRPAEAQRLAASVPTAQGGCNRYPISIVTGGTVDLNVCITDNGIGTTAYPHIDVGQVPPLLDPTCQIGIELWDSDNNHYGATKQVPCAQGSYDGDAFGPVTTPLTLHTFARFTCLVACTSDYLANDQGDSPSIQVQPTVVTTPSGAVSDSEPQTEPSPVLLPPLAPPPPGDTQDDSPCSQDEMLGYWQSVSAEKPTAGAGRDDQGKKYRTYSGTAYPNGPTVEMAGRILPAQEENDLTALADAMRAVTGRKPTSGGKHAEPKVAAYMALHPQIRYVCLAINNPDGPCDVAAKDGPNAGMQIGCRQDLPDMLCRGQLLDVFWRPGDVGALTHQPFRGNLDKKTFDTTTVCG
jgi:hypothetical protein